MHRECTTCMGPHDDEIHQATCRVRAWFRSHVRRSILSFEEIAIEPGFLATAPVSATPSMPVTTTERGGVLPAGHMMPPPLYSDRSRIAPDRPQDVQRLRS